MADEETVRDVETGGRTAPRLLFRSVLRLAGFLVVAGAIVLVGLLVVGRLPSGTETGSLVVRGATGLAIGILLALGVRRVLAALTDPPPPSPPRVDARSVDVVYECTICGTRLRLEVAATGKAPRHCGEQMEAEVASSGH